MLKRPKMPTENRHDLAHSILALLKERYYGDPEGALLCLIGHFTTLDLIGIRDQLKKEAK